MALFGGIGRMTQSLKENNSLLNGRTKIEHNRNLRKNEAHFSNSEPLQFKKVYDKKKIAYKKTLLKNSRLSKAKRFVGYALILAAFIFALTITLKN